MTFSDWPGEGWIMTGMMGDKQVLGRAVEIISSTFELNFEMPERFPTGDIKEVVGFIRLELRTEVSLEIHILKIVSVWVVFKATGMDAITWGGRLE